MTDPLDDLQRGRHYVSLGEYKERGNYQYEKVKSEEDQVMPLASPDPKPVKEESIEEISADPNHSMWEKLETFEKYLDGKQETSQNELESEKESNSTPEEEKTLKSHSKQSKIRKNK